MGARLTRKAKRRYVRMTSAATALLTRFKFAHLSCISSAVLSGLLGGCWQIIRRLSGDDGYERYLAYHKKHAGVPYHLLPPDHACRDEHGRYAIGGINASPGEFHTHATDLEAVPLSREAWVTLQLQQKWSGIKRCC